MKNMGLWIGLGVVLAIVVAIVSAGQMGEKSAAFARGKVVLADNLKDDATGIRTLYITVFDQNRPMPPYGAFRKTLSEDPAGEVYEFAVTQERLQVMMEGSPWPATARIKARLDRDGLGGPDQPGDLVGEVESVQPGTQDLVITIDKKI